MFPVKLASRLDPIKPSITLAVTAKAAKLKASGVDVISFGAGEPDFDTPEHIKETVRAALAEPRGAVGKYTEVGGTATLRKAIAAELSAVHKVELDPDQVLVSCGAKHSLYNLFMALLDPGDEVLIPAPYWVSYPDMVMLAGGRPVVLETRAEDDFAVTAHQVREACTGRTRAIVLNNPSNPTGAVYTRAQVEALAEVCVEKNLLIISDDIYRQLVYGDAHYHSIAAISPEAARRTVLVDGVSKTYAMTGYRIGYFAGPKELVAAAQVIQGQTTSGPATLSLHAALAALTDPSVPAEVAAMKDAFTRRRALVLEGLKTVPGVEVLPPDGAFYVFIDASRHTGPKARHADDIELAQWLLEEKLVAIVPGSPFGAPGYLRMSYATDDASLTEGIEQLADAFRSLPTS